MSATLIRESPPSWGRRNFLRGGFRMAAISADFRSHPNLPEATPTKETTGGRILRAESRASALISVVRGRQSAHSGSPATVSAPYVVSDLPPSAADYALACAS